MSTDIETDLPAEGDIKGLCDVVVTRAAKLLMEQGAPLEMVLDRLLTFTAAHAVSLDGVENTATAFRTMADNVESGIFDRFDAAKGGHQGQRH